MMTMKIYSFFNGFCFQGEEELFQDLLSNSPYALNGFSYGAIKAFKRALAISGRVDKLVLISPAFFQTTDLKTKKLQKIFFGKDTQNYLDNFYKQCIFPSDREIEDYKAKGTKEELGELLDFVWEAEKLESLIRKGVSIEVHIGEKDKIINSDEAKEFFQQFGTVYYYKDKGHLLQ